MTCPNLLRGIPGAARRATARLARTFRRRRASSIGQQAADQTDSLLAEMEMLLAAEMSRVPVDCVRDLAGHRRVDRARLDVDRGVLDVWFDQRRLSLGVSQISDADQVVSMVSLVPCQAQVVVRASKVSLLVCGGQWVYAVTGVPMHQGCSCLD